VPSSIGIPDASCFIPRSMLLDSVICLPIDSPSPSHATLHSLRSQARATHAVSFTTATSIGSCHPLCSTNMNSVQLCRQMIHNNTHNSMLYV
jgi:hypothetical protein